MSRTYGHAALNETLGGGRKWFLTVEPQVAMLLRRIYPGLNHQFGTLKIDHTLANCELLEMVLTRYPLETSHNDAMYLRGAADTSRQRREECVAIASGARAARDIKTLVPLRPYQGIGAEMILHRHALLCGDDLGLGKTAVALGAIAAGLTPAVIVCQTHLQRQWVDEANKFLAGVKPHIVKTKKTYILPEHDILVIPYSKLAGWAESLEGYRYINFDEVQELRIADSDKGRAAKHACEIIPYRSGLSATPIYNYGDEIFTIVNLLEPGILGTREEFLANWCYKMGLHYLVTDPAALGAFLMEQGIFLRRRRNEVGRELPPVTRVTQEVEYNKADILQNEDKALHLAQRILHGSWAERGKAALELDAMLRMQTGIAKAPFVAEFVRQMVESGEKVVLCGWHREVYTIWQRLFERAGIACVLYTGSESPAQKAEAVRRFTQEESDELDLDAAPAAKVFIMSLRSGAGLNGLQRVSGVIVFGELDWSPQVHEQCIGRLQRDEQAGNVTAVYLYAGGGSDPVIANVLGIKKSQSEGIINPGDKPNAAVFDQQLAVSRAGSLARSILGNLKGVLKDETGLN